MGGESRERGARPNDGAVGAWGDGSSRDGSSSISVLSFFAVPSSGAAAAVSACCVGNDGAAAASGDGSSSFSVLSFFAAAAAVSARFGSGDDG
jgi:hypothetical protein